MAEVTTEPVASSSCCAPATQSTCCEASAKEACCATSAADGTCGCGPVSTTNEVGEEAFGSVLYAGADVLISARRVGTTGCIAGALTGDEFREGLATAGFAAIEVRPTHRVHEHASSAIIRARKPE